MVDKGKGNTRPKIERDKDNELDDSGCVLPKGTGHPMSCLAITFTARSLSYSRPQDSFN